MKTLKLSKERREFLLKRKEELEQKNRILYKARDVTVEIIDLLDLKVKKMKELQNIETELKKLHEQRDKIVEAEKLVVVFGIKEKNKKESKNERIRQKSKF